MTDNSYLPQTGDDPELIGFSFARQPSRTYKLDIDRGRVKGVTDEADALLQAVYLILSVERYQYPIYSYNYGVELADLIGQPVDYVMSEAKRRISDALARDDRIISIDGWEFEKKRSAVKITFVIHSVYGDIETAKEVDI